MSRLTFYLIRCCSILSSCVVPLVRFDFRRFRQAIKEILIAISAYVRDRSVQADGTGRHFVGKDAYSHVTQLFGDAMTFDYSPWHGKVGLCFVNAAHSYEYVKSDTENTFRMLADDGIILWHDS